jgi:hypothetical protein
VIAAGLPASPIGGERPLRPAARLVAVDLVELADPVDPAIDERAPRNSYASVNLSHGSYRDNGGAPAAAAYPAELDINGSTTRPYVD